MPKSAPPKGVFESPEAADAFDAACNQWDRAEDGWETVKWVLAHDPEPADSYVLDDAGRHRVLTWQGASSAHMPTITVVYEWDNENVTILDARFENAKAQRFGHA